LRIAFPWLFARKTIKIFLDTSSGRRHFETIQSLHRRARRHLFASDDGAAAAGMRSVLKVTESFM
jgi:hypothetical protein